MADKQYEFSAPDENISIFNLPQN